MCGKIFFVEINKLVLSGIRTKNGGSHTERDFLQNVNCFKLTERTMLC